MLAFILKWDWTGRVIFIAPKTISLRNARNYKWLRVIIFSFLVRYLLGTRLIINQKKPQRCNLFIINFFQSYFKFHGTTKPPRMGVLSFNSPHVNWTDGEEQASFGKRQANFDTNAHTECYKHQNSVLLHYYNTRTKTKPTSKQFTCF